MSDFIHKSVHFKKWNIISRIKNDKNFKASEVNA